MVASPQDSHIRLLRIRAFSGAAAVGFWVLNKSLKSAAMIWEDIFSRTSFHSFYSSGVKLGVLFFHIICGYDFILVSHLRTQRILYHFSIFLKLSLAKILLRAETDKFYPAA